MRKFILIALSVILAIILVFVGIGVYCICTDTTYKDFFIVSKWEKQNAVDKFGDPTDERYMSQTVNGTADIFGIAASTTSQAVIYDGKFGVAIWEYGVSVPDVYGCADKQAEIKLGNEVILSCRTYFGNDKFYFDDEVNEKIFAFLERDGGDIKIVITLNMDYGVKEYRCAFSSQGYNKTYNSWLRG